MDINYSNYSLEELFEAKESIDKSKYQSRYQAILAEIELRKKQGEQVPVVDDELEEKQFWQKLFVYNFSDKKYRVTFALGFTIVCLHLLSNILPALFHTKLSNLPPYETTIDLVLCKSIPYTYKGKDRTSYDFKLKSYGFSFYVVDMKKGPCQNAASQLKKGDTVTIWYENDLIYQLAHGDNMILPYDSTKRYVWHEKLNMVFVYIFILFLFVNLFFKSFINCFSPNTFIVELE